MYFIKVSTCHLPQNDYTKDIKVLVYSFFNYTFTHNSTIVNSVYIYNPSDNNN